MATVTRENISPLNDRLTVTIAREDYLPSFEKALREYGKKANIPGFRKGMVPAGLIKKMYGNSVLTDEVLRTVEKELTNYMMQEKLDIFAQPLPLPENDARKIDVSSPAEYAFAFEVGLKPEFTIDLNRHDFKRFEVDVTDEMINEEVNRLQLRNGKMTEPEVVTGDDNVLNIVFTEADAAGNPVEGGIVKDNSLLVKYFNEKYRSEWLGKKAGDSLLIQPSAAFDDKEREWIANDLGLAKDTGDLDKYFIVNITKLGLVERSPLDEEFFNVAFPGREIKTEESFRDAIREDIKKQWDSQSRNQLQHAIYHDLLDHTHIDFPEEFLKRWLQTGTEQPKTAEEAEKELPTFLTQLKWTLIVNKIVVANKIEVAADEIKNAATQQLLGYMQGQVIDPDQPWIADYANKMMQDRKFVEETMHRIETEKVFAWAEGQVNTVTQQVSSAEFLNMQKEHDHKHH